MGKGKTARRRYPEEFKRRIVAEANAADVSVSEIARRHGLNANLVFNWRKKFGSVDSSITTEPPTPTCQLVPVDIRPDEAALLPEAVKPAPDIEGPASAVGAEHARVGIIEIMLPCGSRVRCSTGVEPALLGQAVTALRPGGRVTTA